MKKLVFLVVVLAVAGGSYYYYRVRGATAEPTVMTQPITRGDIVQTVGATGTLEAVETVDVGTQVSGVVQKLHADFNSIVKQGQVIAQLDPKLIQSQIEQQAANVARAEAELERLKVALADALQKYDRAQQMAAKQLIPRTELETAEVNVKAAQAQIRSSEAALTQARAQLNNQKVNLAYTTITAPIDGIVISRNVDEGQTVASSMNAPTLYVIAADLTKMQVIANIDEADVGNMRPGQQVTFRVDAFPADTFTGTVSQVRLQPAVVQNVVTYSTVIAVPNPELKLKPGMTANVSIEIARRTNVLRVPNAATRFRPTAEMFAVLKQPVPPELERGRGGAGGRGTRGAGPGSPGGAPGAPAAAPPGQAPAGQTATAQRPDPAQSQSPRGDTPSRQATSGGAPGGVERGAGSSDGSDTPRTGRGPAQGEPGAFAGRRGEGFGGGGRGGFDPNMSPEERRKRLEERLASMSPEERERFQTRMREGGFGRGGGGREAGNWAGRGGSGRGAGPGNSSGGSAARTDPPSGRTSNDPQPSQSRTMTSGATTIDSLFGPLPVVETRATVWQYENKQLKPIRLRLGITDQTYTEVLNEADVPPNAEVVINMITGLEPRNQQGQTPQNNPLLGPQRGRGGPGGFGPGPGGGGGGRGRG